MTPDANGARDGDAGAAATEPADADRPDVPDWDDEYVDRVSGRLLFNYDLERDFRTRGERFTLHGELHVESHKQFFHPALSYGHHESDEHLFVRRVDRIGVAALERLVDLGHALADEWIEPDEEHFSTDFTFAVVVDALDADVRSFVEEFKDRTRLKYGYHGHYEINLIVVAPDHEDLAASPNADVADAFRLWADDAEPSGLFERLVAHVRQ